MPSAAIVARLKSINPGRITIKLPIKPTITADHLLKPTFSFKIMGDKAVVINGATNASVKAFAIEIIDIEKKNNILAKNKVKPLKNCSLGSVVQVRFFLKKKNIKGNAKKTVKKYLAQVIWKNDKSELRYLAIVSIKGSIAQANKL